MGIATEASEIVPGQFRRKVSFVELAQHSTPESLWISIAGKVYDVTTWQKVHPGGLLPLLAVAGGDATDVFRAMHPKHVSGNLPQFFVGDLDASMTPVQLEAEKALPGSAAPGSKPYLTPEEKEMIADFRVMSQKINKSRLATPDPFFYVQRALVLSLVLSAVVAGVVLTDSPVVHLGCAIALGMFWNQMNFIGHDAGHNAITGVRSIDSAIGYVVGNALTGISIGWWKRSHNVHHVACNSVTHDADLQHVPVFAVSNSFFGSIYSAYHFRRITFDALAQFLISYQHITFYPIMAVARINLYIQSLLLFFSHHRLDNRAIEAASMLFFWAWFGALLSQLPNMWERVAFFFVSHAVTGILHVQICMSHFSMPTYEGCKTAALWFRTQVEGSLDVSCSPYLDWFHGGLQFQIEHHLFPRLPRRNLRAISPLVREFCKKHRLQYTSISFWEANVYTVNHLRKRAMEARHLKLKCGKDGENFTSSFLQSLLWDAMNARG